MSARYLAEITLGIIYVPTEFYPDINSAVRRAKSSTGGITTIQVAEGNHHMTDKHHAGYNHCVLDFAVHIIGEGAEKTIINGMFELQSNGKCKADKNGSLIYEGKGITFSNIGITNPTDKHGPKSSEQSTTRGIWSDRGLPLTMNACTVFGCKGDGLYIRGGSYLRMNRCKVHTNQCQGVFLSGAGTLGLLIDLETNNNGDSGLYCNRGADIDVRGFKTTVHHNGMYKEKRYGLKVSGTDSEIRIHLPATHTFLVDNGLHVKSNDCAVGEEEVHTTHYERSPLAKNMSAELNGTIRYAKLSEKQLRSYSNFLNSSNQAFLELQASLCAQGYVTFPDDSPDIMKCVDMARKSKGQIKEIKIAPGRHDFKTKDCYIEFPIAIRGGNGEERPTIVGEFVVEGDPASTEEVVFENLNIQTPGKNTYGILSEGGRPIKMIHCEISNIGGTAVHISTGSTVTMVQCHVHTVVDDGIYINGEGSRGFVTDCHVHHVEGGSGVYCGSGATLTIDGSETNVHECMYGISVDGKNSRVNMDMGYDKNSSHDNESNNNFHEDDGGQILYVDAEEEKKRREDQK